MRASRTRPTPKAVAVGLAATAFLLAFVAGWVTKVPAPAPRLVTAVGSASRLEVSELAPVASVPALRLPRKVSRDRARVTPRGRHRVASPSHARDRRATTSSARGPTSGAADVASSADTASSAGGGSSAGGAATPTAQTVSSPAASGAPQVQSRAPAQSSPPPPRPSAPAASAPSRPSPSASRTGVSSGTAGGSGSSGTSSGHG